MRANVRKGLATGFVVAAAVLTMASVAYACTTYKGRMTVDITSGSDGHSGHTQTAGIGKNNGMSYCTTLPSDWGSTNNPKGQAHLTTAGGNITVTVAPQDDVCPGLVSKTNRLSNGTDVYNVNFNPGKMFTSSTSHNEPYVRFNDCMNNEPGNIVLDSNFDVSSGSGSGSYTIGSQTANNPNEDGGVCVAKDGNGEGMQVPLSVV